MKVGCRKLSLTKKAMQNLSNKQLAEICRSGKYDTNTMRKAQEIKFNREVY